MLRCGTEELFNTLTCPAHVSRPDLFRAVELLRRIVRESGQRQHAPAFQQAFQFVPAWRREVRGGLNGVGRAGQAIHRGSILEASCWLDSMSSLSKRMSMGAGRPKLRI